MKMVTLYRIQKDKMPIPHGDRIEWCRIHEAKPYLLKDEGGGLREITVERKHIPVERVCRSHKNPATQKVTTQEWYIAVEPELKDLLTLDYQAKLRDADTKMAGLKNQLHDREWLINKMQTISERWWAQPWYKRVWFAIFS